MSASEDPNDQESHTFRSISNYFSPSNVGKKNILVAASDKDDDADEEEEEPIIVSNSRAAIFDSSDYSDEDSCSSDVEILISLPSTDSETEDYAMETEESELEMTLPTKKSKVSPRTDFAENDESIYIEQPDGDSIKFVPTKEILAPGSEVDIETISESEPLPIAASEVEAEVESEIVKKSMASETESDIRLSDEDEEFPIAKPPVEEQESANKNSVSKPVPVSTVKPASIASPSKLPAALAKLSPVRVFYADPAGKAESAKKEKVIDSTDLNNLTSAVNFMKPVIQPSIVLDFTKPTTPSQLASTATSTQPSLARSNHPVQISSILNAVEKPVQTTATVSKPVQTTATVSKPVQTTYTAPVAIQPVQRDIVKEMQPGSKPQQPTNSVDSKTLQQLLKASAAFNENMPTPVPLAPATIGQTAPGKAVSSTIAPSKPTTLEAAPVKVAPIQMAPVKTANAPTINVPIPLTTSHNATVRSASTSTILAQTAPLQVATSNKGNDLPKTGSSTSISAVSTPAATSPVPQERPKTAFVYDKRMLLHKNLFETDHPECPDRISRIYDHLKEAGLLKKAEFLPVSLDSERLEADLTRVHDLKYHQSIQETAKLREVEEFAATGNNFNSVYLNEHSSLAASVAAAATTQLCRSIAQGEFENGFAIVRPPGHHAEYDEAMGFCLYNNVAVAAKNLYETGLAKRILILDWDVHHGNGTQNAFVENPDVLYISLHRYDNGTFYPHIDEANHSFVGVKPALGRSVNVAWNGSGMGDGDYLYAFSRLIMPISREFNPDFVIVSAGFDAAQGDPIGQCLVTPFGYASMLHELSALAAGKVAVVLEGGYDLDVITRCYEACVRTLLHEALPKAPPGAMVSSLRGASAVEQAVCSQSPHWRSLFPKLAEMPAAHAEAGIDKNLVTTPMRKILEFHWREECKNRFQLLPKPLLFTPIQDREFILKYVNLLLVQEKCFFSPDVLLVFAHESGPLLHTGIIPSTSLQAGRISQYTPFLDLMQACSSLSEKQRIGLVNLAVPARTWKLKQTGFGDERECEELKTLMLLVWDQVVLRSGCKKIIFISAGAPCFGIANLMHQREVIGLVQGIFFFSSTLFLPLIDAPGRSEWYRRNSMVIVPSSQERGTVLGGIQDKFGKCVSGGQVLMADSGAMVSSFSKEILKFIRERGRIK